MHSSWLAAVYLQHLPPVRFSRPICIGNLMPRQCRIISYPCRTPPAPRLLPLPLPRPLWNRVVHNKLTAWPVRVMLIKAHLYLVVHKTLSENEPTWPGRNSCPSQMPMCACEKRMCVQFSRCACVCVITLAAHSNRIHFNSHLDGQVRRSPSNVEFDPLLGNHL